MIAIAATRRLLALSMLAAALSVLAVISPSALSAVLAFDGAVLALAAVDVVLAWRVLIAVDAQWQGAPVWSRERDEHVVLRVRNHGWRAVQVRLRADLPSSMTCVPHQHDVRIAARSEIEVDLVLNAAVRGRHALHGAHMQISSPVGLWTVRRRVGPTWTVHVHPDLKQLAEYALLARAGRLQLIGVRRARRGGGDTEFERLRDRVSDDPLRSIDWKATARRDQLTVRDYQISQSQALVVLVDAGRLMATTFGSGHRQRTMLDAAIDSALMLAHVAVGQRDRVGLIAYAGDIRRRVPASAGPRAFRQLVHALHDVEVRSELSRPDIALTTLARHERKRCLAVLITHVMDRASADLLERHATALAARHLPLIVLLRDADVHAVAALDAVAQTRDWWRQAAAAAVLSERREFIARLERAGCLVVDCAGERLTPELISQYLAVKAAHRL